MANVLRNVFNSIKTIKALDSFVKKYCKLNGDLIIKAHNGKLRMYGTDIEMHATGSSDSSKGNIRMIAHETIELKALNINVPLFTFLGWKNRPAEFVVPVWEEPMIADGEVSMSDKVAAATQAQIDRQELTDDDIPF